MVETLVPDKTLSRWTVTITLLVICSCLACDTASQSPPAVPTERVQDLRSRPLTLPSLALGADCPVSAVQTFRSSQQVSKQAEKSQVPSQMSGTWPVFLSGQRVYFAGVAAELWISAEYHGPLLVRGRQLDGSGGMPLATAPGSGSSPVGAEGLELSAASDPGWREWAGEIATGTRPGCYGLQADGFTFTALVIFAVTPGSPQPA